jgi:hypothetical protein
VVHAIFVWTIYSGRVLPFIILQETKLFPGNPLRIFYFTAVIIPILQRYIMDSILEQAKLSLLSGDYSKYKGMYEQFTKF